MRLFLHLRYDEMARLFPHEPFSVNEAGFDFFTNTLEFVKNGVPQNRPGSRSEDAKFDIYWKRYRDWIIECKH